MRVPSTGAHISLLGTLMPPNTLNEPALRGTYGVVGRWLLDDDRGGVTVRGGGVSRSGGGVMALCGGVRTMGRVGAERSAPAACRDVDTCDDDVAALRGGVRTMGFGGFVAVGCPVAAAGAARVLAGAAVACRGASACDDGG